MEFEEIITIITIISINIAFFEFRFRHIHVCSRRIEAMLKDHLKEVKPVIERFIITEEQIKNLRKEVDDLQSKKIRR